MKQGLLIDMDGVIYSGEELIQGADKFIKHLIDNDIPFAFMTNNSQRTSLEVVRKLKRLGITVETKHIYTSAMATGKFLGDQSPNGTAFVLGEGGLLSSLHENGITLVDSDPEFVVLGEGRNFTLEMVQRAVDMILAGAKFITTNRDPSPKKPGWNNLGIAATTAMIEEATGRKAFVTGKPSPVMMRSARKFLGLETAETTVIGDTMETDIQGGVQMGYKTILVLSGISSKDQLSHYAFKPDMIASSVDKIVFPLKWWS
ncbi:HAD-IIA family hydrolase [Mucilaginibacter sp. P25]|uniref:HAD-IIA family hydrolase n=2 Tax=Mucilaginibacter TaxID=423349 RepID=A0AAE6JFJ1_9SPHI|nr:MULTISPECIES: HAD-IIA family hydrolase [Mucilaginibacter]QEM03857.1 HAD-IIA family hydrolase [Mucilaginibacter rubeus]QEM16468.1 HAD-IIA family hydrolase [Mucilaginibacter gossypii]QTE38739.1 HAD-IIA family hydrolase [Mucilaginibacter gossypii]QTE40766.1 HAD-IIA family hydrolase [Mucilaginibacter rubeus]QTE47368.1 HAD-IIA family hydrolase [Mucilaginibacter rubeus]